MQYPSHQHAIEDVNNISIKTKKILKRGLEELELSNQFDFIIGPATNRDSWKYDFTTDGVADQVQINDCLSKLPSGGGAVLLKSGTYVVSDFISMPSNSTLYLGEGCIIKPANNFTPTTQIIATLTQYSFITNSDHTSGNTNIRIINGRVTAQGVTGLPTNVSGQPSTCAIWFHKVTDSFIEGVTVDNILYTVTGGEISDVRQYGILLTECARISIHRCKIEYVGNDCISIRRDSSFCRVENCVGKESKYGHSMGQDAGGAGLIYGSAGGVVEGNVWIGNTVIGNRAVNTFQQGGITAHGSRYPLIVGNSINDCGDGVVIIGDTQGATVTGNTINEPYAYGIVVLSSDTASLNNTTITGNTILMATGGGSEYGIYLWISAPSIYDLTGTNITGNTIVGSDGSTQVGIYINGQGAANILDTKISNNWIKSCGTGILGDTNNVSCTIGRTWIKGNSFRECTKSVRFAKTAAGTISNGDISNNDITSTKASGVGIECTGATYFQVSLNRIAVTGTSAIPAQELTGCDNNKWTLNRTTLSTSTGITIVGSNSQLITYESGLLALNANTAQSTVGGLDVASGGISLVVGADSGSTGRTNSTTKVGRIASAHYTNATAPALIAAMSNGVAANSLLIGGGSTINTGATSISLYTNGTSNTDLGGGTARLSIDSAGVVSITGSLTIGTPLGVASGGTGLSALGAGVATWLGTPSSANLAAALTDETGTAGNVVFSTGPTLQGPVLVDSSSALSTNGGIDISSGGIGLVLGADNAAKTRTNATTKVARCAGAHYTNATAPVLAYAQSNGVSTNTLLIGGGSTTNTGATSISFYTNGVSNTDLSGGTARLSIDSAGVVNITGSLTIATPLAIGQGGTGQTTASAAMDALEGAEATIASATTTDIGASTSNKVSITGTTTITSFGTKTAGVKRSGRFTGALTLTHNATSLILPGGANITTVAGDRFEAVSLGSGNWVVYFYQKATVTGSGSAVLATSPTLTTPTLGVATVTSVNKWGFTAPTTACTLTSGVDNATYTFPGQTATVGYMNIPQNSQSADYTLVLLDQGKHILHPSADVTGRTFTIPANASVPYAVGTELTFVNQNGAGSVSIAITTDTMRLAGAGTTGTRTLAANGIAKALKITTTEWIISGTGLT